MKAAAAMMESVFWRSSRADLPRLLSNPHFLPRTHAIVSETQRDTFWTLSGASERRFDDGGQNEKEKEKEGAGLRSENQSVRLSGNVWPRFHTPFSR